MNNLNDLLNNTFGKGKSQSSTKKEVVKTVRTQKTRGIYLGRDELVELKIALNYAINSIKRKSDVTQQKENSTYFSYFTAWNKIREKLKEKLEN